MCVWIKINGNWQLKGGSISLVMTISKLISWLTIKKTTWPLYECLYQKLWSYTQVLKFNSTVPEPENFEKLQGLFVLRSLIAVHISTAKQITSHVHLRF